MASEEIPDLIGRAQRYAATAFAFSERFPFPSKGRHAATQFYEASSSATSNYCAAKRGRSTAEFISKLGTVVEEIDEAVRWLEHMQPVVKAIAPTYLSTIYSEPAIEPKVPRERAMTLYHPFGPARSDSWRMNAVAVGDGFTAHLVDTHHGCRRTTS